jgi:hypothetical protein
LHSRHQEPRSPSAIHKHKLTRTEIAKAARQMMEDVMAKVIKFFIPEYFLKKVNCIAPNQRGKVIEFPSAKTKSA